MRGNAARRGRLRATGHCAAGCIVLAFLLLAAAPGCGRQTGAKATGTPTAKPSSLGEALELQVYLSQVDRWLNWFKAQQMKPLETRLTGSGRSRYAKDPVKYAIWQEHRLDRAAMRFQREIRYMEVPAGVRHGALLQYARLMEYGWFLGVSTLVDWQINSDADGLHRSFKEKDAAYSYYTMDR